MNSFNEYGTIRHLGLRHVRDAFVDRDRIEAQWRKLNYSERPNLEKSLAEYEAFVTILKAHIETIEFLPANVDLTLDSLYVRDTTLVSPKGLIFCNMGKPDRRGEPVLALETYAALGLPICGSIEEPGRIEGGDVIWLDAQTCAVGRGYRTNEAGIRQLGELLDNGVHIETVPLPHYKGSGDVFHLMSIISPLDKDLALVYSPLMPVPFREWLLDRGIRLVEVPDTEFETMGCNVLALAPRKVLMVAGNPETRRRLEAAGCNVITYEGMEISRKGEGGPTCLTRPLLRT